MSDTIRTTVIDGSVTEAVSKLSKMLADRGVELFAIIDHGAGAAKAGMQLGSEVVVLFGSPSVGTRLMQEDRRTGLELPLRILLWDDAGVTQATYADPHVLADRFDVKSSGVLDAMRALMETLVEELAAGSE
jgi:uncharacterized protein (DUF302 family)